MPIFTVSPDLLESIEDDEKTYLRDILFAFTQKNSVYKIAKDKNSEILDIYKNIKNNADIIKTWLELMSFKPAKFEKINIDLSHIHCTETKFFELCASTHNSKKLIVYSKQNITQFTCSNNYVDYNNNKIYIMDRDEANVILNKHVMNQITYINSQVAQNGSKIIDSNNN